MTTAERMTRELGEALDELAGSHTRESRLTMTGGPAFLVVVRDGGRELRVEAAGSRHLPAELSVSQSRGQTLRNRGYAKGNGGRFERGVRNYPGDRQLLAAEMLAIMAEVYGQGLDHLRVRLVHDDREHPDNPRVVEAMRSAVGEYAESSRRILYNAMVNGTYLMPVADDADDADDDGDEYETVAIEHERPIYAAFTDWSSLRDYKPLVHDYVPVHGSELFEQLVERRVLALRINPDSRVGGELYGHEVETLARGVRTWRNRNAN